MKQLHYEFTDLDSLKDYCKRMLIGDHKVVVQLHVSDKSKGVVLCDLLLDEVTDVQVIPIVEEGIEKTHLHFSLYSKEATLEHKKESFFEHDLYKAIIDSTKEGFWLLDEALNIITINNAFANMLGYKKSEVLGKKPYQLFALIDEQQTFCEEQANVAHTSKQRTYELTFVTKKGEDLHTIVNATTITLPDNAKRTFAFITDISEQKELEQMLLQQQYNINELNTNLKHRIEAEVQANRKKDHIMYQQARLASMGEMVANIAHQWRQPLNIIALIIQEFYISGQLGTLNREKIEKEYTRANSVLQYMSSTIDDFRTFFQHNDTGERFSISSAIDSVMTLISKAMEHNKIEVITEIDETLYVFGHKNEFVQTLINLLNNAREAIIAQDREEGKITIKTHREEGMIVVSIQDNGGGIEKEDREQIFEPYFTTKHQAQGTGLGLYMSHQIIVNNMNGTLEVENREEGSCFLITLPEAELKV